MSKNSWAGKQHSNAGLLVSIFILSCFLSLFGFSALGFQGILFLILIILTSLFISFLITCSILFYKEGRFTGIGLSYIDPVDIPLAILNILLEIGTSIIGRENITRAKNNLIRSFLLSLLASAVAILPLLLIAIFILIFFS